MAVSLLNAGTSRYVIRQQPTQAQSMDVSLLNAGTSRYVIRQQPTQAQSMAVSLLNAGTSRYVIRQQPTQAQSMAVSLLNAGTSRYVIRQQPTSKKSPPPRPYKHSSCLNVLPPPSPPMLQWSMEYGDVCMGAAVFIVLPFQMDFYSSTCYYIWASSFSLHVLYSTYATTTFD